MNGDGFFPPILILKSNRITIYKGRPKKYKKRLEKAPMIALQKKDTTKRRCLCPHIDQEEVFMD